MWGVLGQSGRCAGSSADWPFSAGMTNEAPLSRRLALSQSAQISSPQSSHDFTSSQSFPLHLKQLSIPSLFANSCSRVGNNHSLRGLHHSVSRCRCRRGCLLAAFCSHAIPGRFSLLASRSCSLLGAACSLAACSLLPARCFVLAGFLYGGPPELVLPPPLRFRPKSPKTRRMCVHPGAFRASGVQSFRCFQAKIDLKIKENL